MLYNNYVTEKEVQMKPVIIIRDYYQNIYITLGEAIHELIQCHKDMQVGTLLYMFNKCESHAQCMDVIKNYVDILQQKEA